MGTEHEKFGFCLDTLKPLPYDGERSIRAILEGLARQYGWRRVQEEGLTTGLEKDDCSVSLEPGGQLELSGALDRKSTRLNSSHVAISYAVLCLKKKKTRVSSG